MLEIFNTRALTRKQRFTKALIVGVAASLGCLLVNYLLFAVFYVHFSLLFVLFGYLIGLAIQHFGRGVQIQFSVLAAVLTFVVMLISDLMVYRSLTLTLQVLSSFGTDSLFEVAYRVVAVYLAYTNARVV